MLQFGSADSSSILWLGAWIYRACSDSWALSPGDFWGCPAWSLCARLLSTGALLHSQEGKHWCSFPGGPAVPWDTDGVWHRDVFTLFWDGGGRQLVPEVVQLMLELWCSPRVCPMCTAPSSTRVSWLDFPEHQ